MGKINNKSKSNTSNSSNNNVITSSLNKKILPFMSNSYYLSIFIRLLVGVLAIGYIHPDEYFQSPEITSSFMFNLKTFKPWEFSNENPCRSIVIPLFNSGIPFFILNQIQKLIDYIVLNIFNNSNSSNNQISIINGNTLIIAPRIFMVCLSFLLDFYIFKICKHFKLSYRKSLSILSSCWLITIFHSRTFSNTIESLLVATLITLVLLYNEKSKDNSSSSNNNNKKNNKKSFYHYFLKDLLIGSVVACGIFARFTFIFFATPLGIYLFYLFYTNKSKSIISCYFSILLILFGFLATCGFFILVDSIYFKYLDYNIILSTFNDLKNSIINQTLDSTTTTTTNNPSSILNQISNIYQHPIIIDNLNSAQLFSFVKNNLTFTPINSFLYNLDVKNLSDHGIHNRLTHLFVNFPMMVGPLILVLFIEIISILKNNSNVNGNGNNNNNKENNNNNNNNEHDKKNNNNHHHKDNNNIQIKKEILPKSIRILLVSIILFGLFFLSLAPHQEARFLLPLFFPLVLISYRYFYFNKKSSKLLLMLWILFNMLLTIFFGFIHQGGVTPSLIFIGSNIIKKQQQSMEHIKNNNISILYYHTYMPPRYLLGIDKSNENVNLLDIGGNDINTLIKSVESIKNSKIYILSPTKTILYQQYKDKTCQFTDSFWPHLTTEDTPNSIDELRLFMFECVDL